MIKLLLPIAAGAFLLTWICVGIVRSVAFRLRLLDHPNERSSHSRVTPRGGGIGFVITLLFGVLVSWRTYGDHLVSGFSISIFVAFATSVALISLWDDFRSLSVLIRLGVQLSAAIGVVLVFGSDFFVKMSETPWLAGTWAVFVLIWMVGLTNCFNFMDGIDGIAALQGAVTGGTWAVMGVTMGAPSVSILGTLLGGGSLGFLCYNWTPASIFMGDVGSAFLGFCFGVLPLIAAHETSFATRYFPQLPIFAVLIVWPFVADSLFAFGRRLLKGEKVWTPHRTHFYQRLVQAGCSHIEVTAYYGAWSVACSAVGLFFWRNGLGRPAFISSILFVVVTWALVRNFESRTSRACTDATSPN